MSERLVTICSVFWGMDVSELKNLQEWYRRKIYAVRIAVNRWFLTARSQPFARRPSGLVGKLHIC